MTARTRPIDRGRLEIACGFLAPIVGLGALLLSTAVASPETFTWRERALSDMGRYGAETFPLFNGGLLLGGLLGLPFARRLRAESETRLERVGAALVAVATVGLAGVGVFFLEHTAVYLETSLHGPAALTFFLGAPLSQWVYGTGLVRSGDRRRIRVGLASIWLGLVHPLSWLAWLALQQGAVDPGAWFAVPETVAAFAFGGWILLVAAWRRSEYASENDCI